MKNKYAFHIFWSSEDEAFVAVCDEFSGVSGFGDTREEALREAQTALDAVIEVYLEDGTALPEPRKELIAA